MLKPLAVPSLSVVVPQERAEIFRAVNAERDRQVELFPEQVTKGLPLGLQPDRKEEADGARWLTDCAEIEDRLTWRHVIEEEFLEAISAPSESEAREELIQLAALALAAVEDIDRKRIENERTVAVVGAIIAVAGVA